MNQSSVTDCDELKSPRRQQAKAVLAQILEQRERGQVISDSDVLAEHPDISEELKIELELANRIRKAFLWAQRAKPPGQPLTDFNDSEIDQSIEQAAAVEPAEDGEGVPLRLAGYLLLNPVGRGGQAIVYRARQESTGRMVAVKVITGGPFISSQKRARFEREARILAALDHPNIVGIIDQGRAPDGAFFFVMQYVDGAAWDDYWNGQIPITLDGTRAVVQLFTKVAKAVAVAHAHGVVHRDLKPSNVRVDQNGEPHVLDFGLARTVRDDALLTTESITVVGQIVGSLPWASPEQAAGKASDLTAGSDVYSLGVVLYQALTGQFPYLLDGPIDQVLLRVRTAVAPPPSQHPQCRPGVNRMLDAIVLRCLEKSPAARYPAADSLAADLEAWLSGKPIIDYQPIRHGRFPLRSALALVIACLATALFYWYGAKSRPATAIQLPRMESSIGMRLVRIPPGRLLLGSSDREAGREPRHEQLRHVTIPAAFYLGITDVTQAQYQRVMGAAPSDARWRGADYPVDNVSWTDAVEFCRRLGEIDHHRYRLPTADEWEYACRAGDGDPFMRGVEPTQIGWYLENSGGQLQPVAKKLPNIWGLYDMHGDVGQWCSDIDPGSPQPFSGDVAQICRVVRGGNAHSPEINCRSASWSQRVESYHAATIGFRVVCDP